MTIETWSAGLNGAAVTPIGLGGFISYDAKPPGEGWNITGYREVTIPIHPKYGSSQKRQVPIWSRVVTPAPTVQPTSDPIEPAKPIQLDDPIPTPKPEPIQKPITPEPEPEPYILPVQDFKFDEQAAAQESYLEDALTRRMKKFQDLLDSIG